MRGDSEYCGDISVRPYSSKHVIFDETDHGQGVHAVPVFGKPHGLHHDCWCHPELDDGIIVHNVAH